MHQRDPGLVLVWLKVYKNDQIVVFKQAHTQLQELQSGKNGTREKLIKETCSDLGLKEGLPEEVKKREKEEEQEEVVEKRL